MNSRQPHTRRRPFWAAVSLVCAFVVVLGLASAPASARTSADRTKLVLASTSPASPIAGQTFTMKFELRKLGITQHMAAASCYARNGTANAAILAQRTDGATGTCSWSVASGTRGKTFSGILAAKNDAGVWHYRGFDLPIG